MSLEPDPTASYVRPLLAWSIVCVVLLGDLLDLLDSLVTTIAGPSIVEDLGGGPEFLQWLAAGYTVAMAAGLLIGARLGDMYGRKTLFLVGISGFTATSLLAAVSVSPEMLIAARVTQGLMGALMVPQTLGLIKESFPPDKVGTAFGLTGPVLALGGVGGPVLAGWLVDADYFDWGWRSIFAINVPIGVALIVAGSILLPPSRPDRTVRLDIGGASLSASGMAAVVFGLVHGREFSWPWWVLVTICAGIGALVGFALIQRRRGDAGLSTLVTPSLFGNRAFLAGIAIGTLFFGALIGSSLLFALYFQLGLGLSPLMAGLASAPQAVGMIVGFVLAQALGLSRRTMLIGIATIVVGFSGLVGSTRMLSPEVAAVDLLPFLGLLGVGMGLTIAPFFDIVLAGVTDEETGSAAGSLTAVQQLGNALGVAALGTVFFTVLNQSGSETVASYTKALTYAVIFAVVLVLVAATATLALPERARHDLKADAFTIVDDGSRAPG
ncbi:MFS transporter [Rhodococcoides yunnanense]|jgi:EmrB/QacA subfamily drug resistance transporter|uniref:MFS transporter n=1 Tax=Rhodococcoides yunnanense TaxID=278209 RepID=UPI0022B134A1|nr:MFS transporter [Rhodococcus yunnanensis]MCZ4278851.1 MFS transporter [Rhodococcus yunnanensis]